MLAAPAVAAVLALAPSAAFAVGDGPNGAGYNGGAAEAIVVNDGNADDCTVPITVEAGNAGTVTVTVTDSSGAIVSTVSQPNDAFGTIDFVVSLGANCSGQYTISASDEGGFVLATAAVQVEGDDTDDNDGNNAGGDDDGEVVVGGDTGDNVGGLPATGSSNAMLISGLAGAGLLAGGSVLLVRRRRATA
ncbi:LPXTG cell wall anchor domain-containing protein [Nocardioidaceae bacterium]|nr:LPXTG cell wall anchor domain-containing protein [Nocardioidaceae bacterium]